MTTNKATRRITLAAAVEAVRLNDHDLARKLFAECGVGYCPAVRS